MRRLESPNWRKKNNRKRAIFIGVFGGIIAAIFGAALVWILREVVPADNHVLANGNEIIVKVGGDFQAALNQAKSGDTILLPPGGKFVGNFLLPKKQGNQFITIRTSAPDSNLPAVDKRISPEQYSKFLPKLSSDTSDPVISTVDGSHHYRFVGIEFGGTLGGVNNIIRIGSTEERKLEDIPHHIEFDRVYIHATSPEGQRRGIAANGKNIVIKNSHISGIRRKGDESQAIAVWSGDGPIEIVNNYLEAAAENILLGGAGSFLKLLPSDCVIRDNHLNKPPEWKGSDWVVKNLLEIKFGRRVKIYRNLMTNNWAMGQAGTAVLFNTRADNGETDTIEDIEFTDNIVRSSGNAISVYGPEGQGGHRLVIRNNQFLDIDGAKWGGGGHFMISTAWDTLTIENNTIIQSGNITNSYGAPIQNFIFRNNVVFQNEYGFKGDGLASGKNSIDTHFPRAKIEKNVIVGGSASVYGRDNFYPASIRQIGFRDFKSYELNIESPFRTRGVNGMQIGASLNPANVGGR